jgi:hypothetical protein
LTDPKDADDMPHLLDANGDEVCSFGYSTDYYPSEGVPPGDADRALIADAPLMLQLLREAADDCDGENSACYMSGRNGHPRCVHAKIRDFLARHGR